MRNFKFPNRFFSILLQSQLQICLIQEKHLSVTVLPLQEWRTVSEVLSQNVATVNYFVVAGKGIFIWSIYHRSMLVVTWHDAMSLSDIGWACLSYFDHTRGWTHTDHNFPSFLTKQSLISAVISRKGKYNDLSMLKECYPNCLHDCDHFPS